MGATMPQRTEHAIVSLARQAILHSLTCGEFFQPAAHFTIAQQGPAGVFVSLTYRGELRGCIGTYLPTQPNLLQEIVRNAVSAATTDPRFPPITTEELEVSVDILAFPESVDGIDQLDPKRYGVIVRAGQCVGVLLPDIPLVTTAELQVAIARRKAGISPGEPGEISRFEVTRYH
jgi:AmmeMemoRadiSam system protein A